MASSRKTIFMHQGVTFKYRLSHNTQVFNALPCYLGLRAGSVRGEGVLPLGQAEMCDHQSVVGDERGRQEVPAQRAIEEPHFTLLGHDTLRRHF